MIIFGGRKGSGKTLFSNFLQEKGYLKISFASYLKEIVAKLYDFDVKKLYSEEGKSEILRLPLPWNEQKAQELFDLVGITDFNDKIVDTTFYSRRDCIQYIGSTILRGYDPDFHVKKTIGSLDSTKLYVCDDVRFNNELKALLNIGATSFFIIRPNNFEISNHISEVSLKWNNFDNVIINNLPKSKLLSSFEKKLDKISYKKNSPILTEDSKLVFLNAFQDQDDFNNGITAYYAGVLAGLCKFKKNKNYRIEVESNNFTLIYALKNFIDKNLIISNSSMYRFIISNPYIIENLKHWNIIPDNAFQHISDINYAPDIIKNQKKLLEKWSCGLKQAKGF